ncbi:MAG: hypothetical protein PHX80_04870 [Candidatus Nanoarchaeia archaeon]|nr:hypothetical protein [Candidatus Nanoarchaeia archaeon]
MGEPIDSQRWFNNQPKDVWISINDIPGEIFWSVWDIIERNGFNRKPIHSYDKDEYFEYHQCIFDSDNGKFMIKC